VGVLWLLPSGDYLYLPDPARPVEPLVEVPEEPATEEDGGGIYMVDIVVRRARLFERLFPGLYDGASVVPGDVFNPEGVPDRVRRQQSLREMSTSKQIASAVALRALGYDVDSTGAEVVEVEAGSPADGVLRPGDVIVGSRGRKVETPEQLIAAMAEVDPGERVELRVERGGATRTVAVGTRASEDEPPRAVMGVRIQPQLELPVDIEIDAGDVGGPSAGLAFALDIYDELGTDIDEGRRVAVTGELALDGQVLPIGGVKQKTFGARDADADVFLVPDDNAAEARRYADGLRIVAVSSFREALSYLRTGALPAPATN
jgi:PDZ domain-containing protein